MHTVIFVPEGCYYISKRGTVFTGVASEDIFEPPFWVLVGGKKYKVRGVERTPLLRQGALVRKGDVWGC